MQSQKQIEILENKRKASDTEIQSLQENLEVCLCVSQLHIM